MREMYPQAGGSGMRCLIIIGVLVLVHGVSIGAARQVGSNEVKWVDPDVYAGLYVYIMEAELEGGKRKQVRNVMEVME
jgi:hypothetical protein